MTTNDDLIELGHSTFPDHGQVPIVLDRKRLLVTRMVVAGMSGSGKSWLIRRILEATIGSTPTFVLDREADFATLREMHDVALVGGAGDELLASVETAATLARRLVEMRVSAVIDLSQLVKPGEKQRYVAAFLQALIDLPPAMRTTLQVVLDEAQDFAPETGASESRDTVVSFMTLSRKRGIGVILATPRLAMLSKSATSPAGNVCCGRFVLDVDVARACGDLGFRGRREHATLRELEDGEFYCYGQAFQHKGIERFKTGPVQTTHPDPAKGHDFRPPAPSARLRSIVGELRSLQLAASVNESPVPASTSASPDEWNTPAKMVAEEQIDALQRAVERGLEREQALHDQLERAHARLQSFRAEALEKMESIVREVFEPLTHCIDTMLVEPRPTKTRAQLIEEADAAHRARREQRSPSPPPPEPSASPATRPRARPKLRGTPDLARKQRIRVALFHHPRQLGRRAIALYSILSPEGGTFKTYFGQLRQDGEVAEIRDGNDLRFELTDKGVLQLPSDSSTTPKLTRAEIRQRWIELQGNGLKRRMLEGIFDAGAAGTSKAELATKCGTYPDHGSFKTYFGQLRPSGTFDIAGTHLTIAACLLDEPRRASKKSTQK